MRIRRKTLGFLLGVLATLAGVIIVSLFVNREYPSTQTARRSFTIDEDFTNVRKILVRNDSAKQIVTMGGGSEFLSQDWKSLGLDASKPLDELISPDWRVELHGTLRVRTKDEYIGEHNIALGQDVEIKPDFLNSEVHRKDPSERLKQYDMNTRFWRDPNTGKSRVDLKLTQQILTNAPWFAHGIADRRVRQSAEKTLANQENAIRKLIAENKDNVPIFPLR
jgi:hypothetical protein